MVGGVDRSWICWWFSLGVKLEIWDWRKGNLGINNMIAVEELKKKENTGGGLGRGELVEVKGRMTWRMMMVYANVRSGHGV